MDSENRFSQPSGAGDGWDSIKDLMSDLDSNLGDIHHLSIPDRCSNCPGMNVVSVHNQQAYVTSQTIARIQSILAKEPHKIELFTSNMLEVAQDLAEAYDDEPYIVLPSIPIDVKYGEDSDDVEEREIILGQIELDRFDDTNKINAKYMRMLSIAEQECYRIMDAAHEIVDQAADSCEGMAELKHRMKTGQLAVVSLCLNDEMNRGLYKESGEVPMHVPAVLEIQPRENQTDGNPASVGQLPPETWQTIVGRDWSELDPTDTSGSVD
jgi:hypothetical protein